MRAKISPTKWLNGSLTPPSSKNYTTRFMLVSALAKGESIIRFPAHSGDASAMQKCLRSIGASFENGCDGQGEFLRVQGVAGQPSNPGVINPDNAGAVLRFLMGVCAHFDEVRFETDFTESLGQRPHGDLLSALSDLGVESTSDKGRLPIVMRGAGIHGGYTRVSGAKSSQYLSALLFMAPLVGEDIEIEVYNGLVSKPLVRTTLEVMKAAGIVVEVSEDLLYFRIAAGQHYCPREYIVNGDYPSVAAILAAGAVSSGSFSINRLFDDSQGEQAVLPLLAKMGCQIDQNEGQVKFSCSNQLNSVEFDGDQATDAVLAMVAAATLAQGESRFYGIGNLRLKECDRISVPVDELRKLGVDCEERKDEIIVRGNPQGYNGGVSVETHHDHRVAQMLTVVGLRCHNGLTILDAENVNKSYPDFFVDLISLGAKIQLEDV